MHRLISFKNKFLAFFYVLAVLAFVSLLSTDFLMDAKDAPVQFLYTQRYGFSDFLFKMSAAPLALSAFFFYGKPSLSVLPITSASLYDAFSKTEFLVIGTHGEDGNIITDDNVWVGPPVQRHSQLRFIYFGSCNLGLKIEAWQKAFPSAIIRAYYRVIYPVEGWRYLYFQSWMDLMKVKMAR